MDGYPQKGDDTFAALWMPKPLFAVKYCMPACGMYG